MRAGTITSDRRSEAGLFLALVGLPLVFTPGTVAPFMDPKLVVLVAGTMLCCLARPSIDRRVAIAVCGWLASLTIATIVGVDFWWSVLGAENQGTGLIALASAAVLTCCATSVDDRLCARLPSWIVWTGVAVTAVAITGRFVNLGNSPLGLAPLTSTLGHRVFAGAFIAAAIVASTAVPFRRVTYGVLIVLGSGLAVTAVRAAWIAAAAGLTVAIWRGRAGWKPAVRHVGPIVAVLIAWTLLNGALTNLSKTQGGLEFSAAPRFTQLDVNTATQRSAAWRVYVRAIRDRPTVGTGPGTSWYPYLSHARPDEVRAGMRSFADGHNVLLETAVTAGGIGLVALLVLAAALVAGVARGPKDRAWAAGVTVGIAAFEMLQPLNLAITPLLFVAAGLAVGDGARHRWRLNRWVGVAVGAALLLCVNRFAASSLERYGATYASEPALRWALRLEPWRIGATEKLATLRAIDYRSTRETDAAADARELTQLDVDQHGWNPGVRLNAADVEILLGNTRAASSWIRDQLRIFPNDPVALSGAAVLAVRSGDRAMARQFALRALRADPTLMLSPEVLGTIKKPHG